ncbi:beta-phosphoglucomutase [Priestia aryabhattai]|uniref:beta-phosphoglucomutase n=1 Tax=Priestia aryabhattai TaxID=412384 RepID=UPI002882C78A|nr:beta-phosphoglucomutase [Priestia aryabhattai]MDT0149173.1 beta-phosphoglucomutase [Priestia aryabhattai]MDT0154738.1 beta-phosphoglucomutase [Priestia aryabhattai]
MKKEELQAIIFDLDGVIADTIHLYYRANKKVADQLNVSFSEELNQRLQGISRMRTVELIAAQGNVHLTVEQKEELAYEKNKHYQALIREMTEDHLLPGIKMLLEDCKKQGIKMGIASSSSNANTVIDALGIRSFFDCIVDVRKIKKGKPDPEIFLTAADQLKVKPDACVAIEDGEAGIKAINQTDMVSIGIGKHLREEDVNFRVYSTADLHVKTIKEVFEKARKGTDYNSAYTKN